MFRHETVHRRVQAQSLILMEGCFGTSSNIWVDEDFLVLFFFFEGVGLKYSLKKLSGNP